MRIWLNGAPAELRAAATMADAARAAGVGEDERGVAASLDAEVVPRQAWDRTALREDARVEVVRAAAGG